MSDISAKSQRAGSIWDYANPTRFLGLANAVLPWLAGLTVLAFAIGLYLSFIAPEDYQQGRSVLIMFIHVPAAWMALFKSRGLPLSSAKRNAFSATAWLLPTTSSM